jgi:hypothetical protein
VELLIKKLKDGSLTWYRSIREILLLLHMPAFKSNVKKINTPCTVEK